MAVQHVQQKSAFLNGISMPATTLFCIRAIACCVICMDDGCALSSAVRARQHFLASGGAVMAIGDSEAAIRSELDGSQARSLVFDVLTAVIPGLKAEAVDERQELYADLGIDSLRFAQLLVELEGRLNVELDDEDLMTIEFITVADVIDLVERLSLSSEK
jgi:acyl carrier protein